MLDYWLRDLVDCMRREEDKIAGNTRDRGEKQWDYGGTTWSDMVTTVNYHRYAKQNSAELIAEGAVS